MKSQYKTRIFKNKEVTLEDVEGVDFEVNSMEFFVC